MVSRSKNPSSNTTYDPSIHFHTLNSVEKVERFCQNLNLAFRLQCGHLLDNTVIELIKSFINDYQQSYMRLASNHHRKEYREAFKRRYKEICSLAEAITAGLVNDTLSIGLEFNGNEYIIPLDGVESYYRLSEPRSFIKIYKLIRVLYGLWNTKETVVASLQLLTTVASLANDFLLNKEESDIQMKSDIEAIQNPGICPKDSYTHNKSSEGTPQNDILITIQQLVQFAKQKDLPYRMIPAWARQFVLALRQLQIPSYDKLKAYLSGSSSGTKYRVGRDTITVPGFIASAYEKDYIPPQVREVLYNIFGFEDEYGYLHDKRILSRRRVSLAIDQKKPKKRLINILNNSEQDALLVFEYFDHELLKHYSGKRGSDCTMDQLNGPRFMRKCMEEGREYLYSLDLTNATNTWLTENQKDVKYYILSLLYDEETARLLADTWDHLMKQPSSFKYNNGERVSISFNNGQPMGYLSSFKSFAVAHHVLMLTVMRKYAPDELATDFYRILGDDIFFAPKEEVNDSDILYYYQELIHSVNVECNIDKGYVYNLAIGKDKYMAEFAKYLITKDYDLTAIPIKLLCYNKYNITGLLVWLNAHNDNGYYFDDLIPVLEECGWSKNSILYLRARLMLEPVNEFRQHYFKEVINIQSIEDTYVLKHLSLMAMLVAVTTVNTSLLSPLLRGKTLECFDLELLKVKMNKLRPLSEQITESYRNGTMRYGKLFRCFDELELYQEHLKNQIRKFILRDDTGIVFDEPYFAQMVDRLEYINDSNMNFFVVTLGILEDPTRLDRWDVDQHIEYIELCRNIMVLSQYTFERTWVGKTYTTSDIIDMDVRLASLNNFLVDNSFCYSISELLEVVNSFSIEDENIESIMEGYSRLEIEDKANNNSGKSLFDGLIEW